MFSNPWWSFDEIFIWTSSVIEDSLRKLFLIKFSLSPDICAGYHQSLMKFRWSFPDDCFRPSMKLWWEVDLVFIYGWWWPRTRFSSKFSSSPDICLAYHQAPEDVGMKPKVIIFFSRWHSLYGHFAWFLAWSANWQLDVFAVKLRPRDCSPASDGVRCPSEHHTNPKTADE